MIPLFVGYDPRESAAYHTFCQSVLDHASEPVQFIPLHQPMLKGFDGQRDGSNAFIFSRFLVPYLMGFSGQAIFVDGDMICRGDIAELWALRNVFKAAQVVKHEYTTKHTKKYIGSPLESVNVDYPRKNWSSVVIWNCAHYHHRKLTPENLAETDGRFLHRFEWLKDSLIGDLPPEWNWLVGEFDHNPEAKLLHYTLGVPGFKEYAECDDADEWHSAAVRTMHIDGEAPSNILRRAER